MKIMKITQDHKKIAVNKIDADLDNFLSNWSYFAQTFLTFFSFHLTWLSILCILLSIMKKCQWPPMLLYKNWKIWAIFILQRI